jgi:hypothetical protein
MTVSSAVGPTAA